ncbi:hypothetical protein JCGZ_24602 [Jatropha curcas]|uniref:Uncharacterized protein n=2 Tax=Jatropha curcas TaxID=180498 RepID=A0A067L041_JATCU|nr:hypothetical protein JCGZ_24602 [Jatropha curcas]
MANNKLYLPVTPDVSFKPQLAQESLGNISNCRRLLMKFPKDFNLPSKEELLREFSQFGKVNSSRTKIFTRTGSAQVVFINQTDTLAAYHHAKRKKGLFGEINMLLWFDPYENKRRGSKFVIHSPNQKSSPRARNYPPSTHTTNQMQMQPSCDDREACVETNENLSINATFRGSSMGNKGFLQLITTDVSFKPQVSKQSSIGTFSNCQHLRMKFPKDFNLPSKKDLIGKFRRFGKIDLFRTKIFTHMGSAQVVFLHHLDAVCAYQYAKRKKDLFGEANILFWLDRCEKKRRGSKLVVPMPNLKSCLKHTDYLDLHGQKDKKCPLPKPKSCVKISDLHMQEDKKSKKRPWFSIEAPLPDLKSCLRKSDLHGQEDKKCTKRVRFLMET